MSNNTNSSSKAVYIKPTLVEYGSLAERTKMFGLADPTPDALVSLTSLTAVSI